MTYWVSRPVRHRQLSYLTAVRAHGDQTERVQSTQVSEYDPDAHPQKRILGKVIELFRSTTESKKPLEVAKHCIGPGASEKDITRYLHHLSKEGFLSLTYQKGTNRDPRYSALPKIKQISDEEIIELASELGTSRKSDTRSDEKIKELAAELGTSKKSETGSGSLRLLESVETLDPQYIPVCDLCETPAPSVHCEFCHFDLCDACVGNHSSDEAKDHYIVPFELRSLATKYQAESLIDDPDIK